MAEDIRIIHIREFMRTDVAGDLDLAASRARLKEIADNRSPGVRHVLLDCREASSSMSVVDIFEQARGLEELGFGRDSRIALVKRPREDFDRAAFFETCAQNRGYRVRAFREFEAAVMWLAVQS